MQFKDIWIVALGSALLIAGMVGAYMVPTSASWVEAYRCGYINAFHDENSEFPPDPRCIAIRDLVNRQGGEK